MIDRWTPNIYDWLFMSQLIDSKTMAKMVLTKPTVRP